LEPYAIMVRKNDLAFKQLADDVIRSLFNSGEIRKIYDKWFMLPIPPTNVTLNAAMSEQLKKVIAAPTDSAKSRDY
jgi:glutamate/aspartate transport system substrate-binding protein